MSVTINAGPLLAMVKKMKGKAKAQVGSFDARGGMLMVLHEFGNEQVSARPHYGPAFAKNRAAYEAAIKDALPDIASGATTLKAVVEGIAARAVNDVKREIDGLTQPALAPSTVNAKQSSELLIDSGAYYDSIAYRMKE